MEASRSLSSNSTSQRLPSRPIIQPLRSALKDPTKKPNTPEKRVVFADGVRPGGKVSLEPAAAIIQQRRPATPMPSMPVNPTREASRPWTFLLIRDKRPGEPGYQSQSQKWLQRMREQAQTATTVDKVKIEKACEKKETEQDDDLGWCSDESGTDVNLPEEWGIRFPTEK